MKLLAWLKTGWLNLLSVGLITSGLVLIGLSFYQTISSELWYWWQGNQGVYYTIDPTLPDTNHKVRTITPVSKEFGLIIEKLNVNESVIAGVNPFDHDEYTEVLKTTPVAQAKQTSLPGQPGVSYLFGHSTVNFWQIGTYKAPFTLLHKLDKGDRVVTYYQSQRYDYRVIEKKVVPPTDISILQEQTDQSLLVLQTCDPPGEDTARLLIIAELIQPEEPSNVPKVVETKADLET